MKTKDIQCGCKKLYPKHSCVQHGKIIFINIQHTNMHSKWWCFLSFKKQTMFYGFTC